ncbi:MAG TPA: hypothetical protein VMV62_02465 [Candidatus Paceibacterota bacterium]|nr:hypothetical protein [Candidatus Paceibacterota bacterium]
MKKYFPLRSVGALPLGAALAIAFLAVTAAHAATTISTNIQTDGTLSVTSTSTFLGNVGIGTATPAEKLDVIGSVNVSAGSYFKYDDLPFATASTSLYDYFTGGAGNLTMTGSYGTANGYSALYHNTTGNSNTANGYSALYYNTTGNENAAFGYDALLSNTGGSFNTANGATALYYNTTGNYNIAIGGDALHYNTTGVDNTASGYQALLSNTTGSYNTASGSFSLSYNTSGSYNTALGYFAGENIATGYDNILIGANPDVGGDHLTTGTDNICIGFNCILPGGTAATNQLNIGNLIFGTGLTATSSSTSLPGTLTGNIGIGTSTPIANFQVANGNNATTTMELGRSGQNKGSCLKLYRTDGTAIYAYVAAGATTFTLTTTSCANVSNF